MRSTLGCWRAISTVPMYTTHSSPSRAAAVAVATPCCPAPVSAIMRRLPICLRQQGLPQGVVDLVRAGMGQVFALEVDARPAQVRGQAAGKAQRGGPAHVGVQQIGQLAWKAGSTCMAR